MKRLFLLLVFVAALAGTLGAPIALLGNTLTAYPYVTSPLDQRWLNVSGLVRAVGPIYPANDNYLTFDPSVVVIINAETADSTTITPIREGDTADTDIIAAILDDQNTIWVLLRHLCSETTTLRTLSLDGVFSKPYITIVPSFSPRLAFNDGKVYVAIASFRTTYRIFVGNSTRAIPPFTNDLAKLIIINTASPFDIPEIFDIPFTVRNNLGKLLFDPIGTLIMVNVEGELLRFRNGVWEHVALTLSSTGGVHVVDYAITKNFIIIGGNFFAVDGVAANNIAALTWHLNGTITVFPLNGGIPSVRSITAVYDVNGALTNDFYTSVADGLEVHFWDSSTNRFFQVANDIPEEFSSLIDIAARRPPVSQSPSPSAPPSSIPTASASMTSSVIPSSIAPSKSPSIKPSFPPSKTLRPTFTPLKTPSSPINVLVLFGPPEGWKFGGTKFDWGEGKCKYIERKIPDRLPLGVDNIKFKVTTGPAIRLKPDAHSEVGCSNFFYPFLDLSRYNEIRFWYKSNTKTLFEVQVDNAPKQAVRLGPARRWTQGAIHLNFSPEQLSKTYGPLLITAVGESKKDSRTVVANIIATRR